jgi:hypothetical protein
MTLSLKSVFVPGYIDPRIRVLYFLCFLILTVLQVYFSLQMEEQISIESEYPENMQTPDFIY